MGGAWTAFDEFFRLGSDGHFPFPYQRRLAEMDHLPDLARIPTGLGKTLAVTLGWIWRRRYHPDHTIRQATPRRLVYVLPMRTLVEQTLGVVQRSLAALALDDTIGLHYLMGGHIDKDWALYPEREAVLVGTQDMLLSRALNRGYGESRFAWPRHFGLLNADVLWVVDEVQLMGSALATTVQLDQFRRDMGIVGPTKTLWMSATAEPEWLTTVDRTAAVDVFSLDDADHAHPAVQRRLAPPTRLRPFPTSATAAATIPTLHRPGTLTLVVCNTVERAQKLYQGLTTALRQGGRAGLQEQGQEGTTEPALVLIHGRFRPAERGGLNRRVLAPIDPAGPGTIVVATQVVEAGVDLSAHTLVTELAPWASLVQRFGRCNRTGDDDRGDVLWIDLADKDAAPYEPEDLRIARATLERLDNRQVSPAALGREDTPLAHRPLHVVRRRDLLGLFDTTPDLSGDDLDVSRFVRDGDDRDVQVFWRDVPPHDVPSADTLGPARDELCAAPLADARALVVAHPLFRWDPLDGAWCRAAAPDIRPGMTLLAPTTAGSYTPTLGWHKGSPGPVEPVGQPPLAGSPEDATDSDMRSVGAWQSLAAHTREVLECLTGIVDALPDVDDTTRVALRQAARLHDWGKGHPCFQRMLLSGATPKERARYAAVTLAKSPRRGHPNERRHFRHELASAVALLAAPTALPAEVTPVQRALITYLVASHHGKVRLGLRSLPGEERPPHGAAFALGVWEGDCLPAVSMPGVCDPLPSVTLPVTGLVDMGRGPDDTPSWVERTLALRDDAAWGPFRLGYLEAILRAADIRASMDVTPARAHEEGGTR